MYGVRTVDRIMTEMPFEVLITVLCLIVGLPMALGVLPPPTSLVRTLPEWSIRCWGSLLSLGGITTLVGLLLSHATQKRRFIEGLYIEGAGMAILGSGALVFGLTIFVAAGWHAMFSVLVYLVMAVSCFFRYRTTRHTVKKMKEAIGIERKFLHGN